MIKILLLVFLTNISHAFVESDFIIEDESGHQWHHHYGPGGYYGGDDTVLYDSRVHGHLSVENKSRVGGLERIAGALSFDQDKFNAHVISEDEKAVAKKEAKDLKNNAIKTLKDQLKAGTADFTNSDTQKALAELLK